MIIYRLIRERYQTTPLSAAGADRVGGRWNPVGFPILYTSATPELALLEVVVHIDPQDIQPRLCWVVIEVPDPGQIVQPDLLSADWYEPSDYRSTQYFLQEWLVNPQTVSVQVPSAIVPISANYLLHTANVSFAEQVHVLDIIPFRLDSRLR